MAEHYLDNSATTPVLREAAEKACSMMTGEFGNPSSGSAPVRSWRLPGA